MVRPKPRRALRATFATFAFFFVVSLPAQEPEKLPDIPTLMRQVEANQRVAEATQQNYIYRESSRLDERDSHEAVKKTLTNDFEIFWLNGVRVARRLKSNGKDLTSDEAKKENDRIDERVKKARERRDKADDAGKQSDSHGNEEITAARILELGVFSNPHREQVNGRATIVVDYRGDPHAKTRNRAEAAFRELAGTVWIDEADQVLQHVEGHFDHSYSVGFGAIISVKEGTRFKATFVKINNEVWLPEFIEADGHARYLLFFSIDGHFQASSSDYRKFKATSTVIDPNPDPIPATPPQP